MVKSVGLKLVTAIPDWYGLNIDDICHFETYNGAQSGTLMLRYGPSYWCMEAEEKALQHPLSKAVIETVDAVIAAPRFGDTPYPVAWDRAHFFNYTYPLMFWSWDRYATIEWAREHDYPMPKTATCGMDGKPDVDTVFYQWYQAAWQGRVNRITDWAMSFGVKDIWTWMVAFNEWSCENMVWATAGSFHLLNDWASKVRDSGGNPCFVLACLWSVWPGRKAGAIENTRRFIAEYQWDVIVGTEACQSPETLSDNINILGNETRRLGASGIFAADRHIIKPDVQRQAIEIMSMEVCRWKSHLAG